MECLAIPSCLQPIYKALVVIVFILHVCSCCCGLGRRDQTFTSRTHQNKNNAPTTSPPNIVFILADDLGWDDVGFHGSEIKTPNIDKLATEGVILNNYYVQPLCTPTRSAIMTGRYPIHTGMQHYVIIGSQPYGLPLTEKTMAQNLQERGYRTHAVGKWHLGFFKDEYLPTRRGFDSHQGYYLGKEDYFDHTSRDGNYFGYDFHQNGSTLWNETEVYSTEIFTTRAETIIRNHNQTKPLFLYMAHQAVHSGDSTDPIQAPQKYIDRFPYIKNYNRRLFAGVVSALDDSVGRVYQSLQDSGMAHNTVIIFSTDNGGPTNGYDRNAACNWPLRGCKSTLWQGGVRGVGFVHSPLLEKSGYINNNLMHAVDWLPTIMSLVNSTKQKPHSAGTGASQQKQAVGEDPTPPPPPPQHLDGVNQWNSISTNANTTRKEVVLNIDPIFDTEGIIVGDFKLVRGQIKHGRWDGWYPPPSSDEREEPEPYDSWECEEEEMAHTNTDYLSVYKKYMEMKSNSYFNNSKDDESSSSLYLRRSMSEQNLDKLIAEMNEEFEIFVKKNREKNLFFQSERNNVLNLSRNEEDKLRGSRDVNSGKILVKCGPKPANASTNCQPKHKACVFHLTSDPCEYNNLAESLSSVKVKLEARLDFYRSTMVPPRNKPIDPNGNPQLHGGVWKPWM